jgi:hypothetical protein
VFAAGRADSGWSGRWTPRLLPFWWCRTANECLRIRLFFVDLVDINEFSLLDRPKKSLFQCQNSLFGAST